MSQVEERAKYAAQLEFPDADILDPSWDPRHVKRGLEALGNYPIEQFREDFRDFYEALIDPDRFVPEAHRPVKGALIHKPFRIDDSNRIVEIADVFIHYTSANDTGEYVGEPPEHWPDEETIPCGMRPLEIEREFSYDDEFHEIVMVHLMAQIRDIFLNMGEEPPREYRVRGIGKGDILGDGALEDHPGPENR